MIKTAAILISRQPLRPCGKTPWVMQARAALGWLKERGMRLCTSTGMQTWELAAALGSLEHVPLKVFLICGENEFPAAVKDLGYQFDLQADMVDFVRVPQEEGGKAKERGLLARDEAIVSAADVLIPISVRPGGHMYQLIEKARLEGREVATDFLVSKPSESPALAYGLDQSDLNPEIDEVEDKYLLHWTRTVRSAWPGERLLDFYRELVDSPEYPRSALATLRRILSMRKLIASSRHMPANTPTVAFTGLSPREVVPLMKWRARYTQMSFEPYGIGILKTLASEVGLRPVRYFSSRSELAGAAEESWLCQSAGLHTDWRQEKEYRHYGDFCFEAVGCDRLIAITRFPEEALAITRDFGVKAIAMTFSREAAPPGNKRPAAHRRRPESSV